MGLEKTTTFAGLVWVAGILALILFRDAFTGSVTGMVLGLLLVVMILIAAYLVMDGVWKLRLREKEREELQRQAFEDKIYELLQSETGKMEQSVNDNTMHMAKLLVKYINKASQDTIQRISTLEQRVKK